MIDARKVTFTDLFNKNQTSQVRVPDYQRGYSWEKQQIRDFLTDLIEFSDKELLRRPNSYYFLGPIVLMKGEHSDSYYYAVDGQQRLATFIILLSVMRELAAELFGDPGKRLAEKIQQDMISSTGPGGNHRWSYRLGDLDQPFFEKFIQRTPRYHQQVPRNSSNGLIKKSWNYLESEIRDKLISESKAVNYLEQLYENLITKVELVAVEVNGERDAMNVFERINVRGKPLSESDLIRHRLMSGCNQRDRGRLRSEWDNLETLLGGQEAKIDTFLKHMWISRHGERTSSKLYDEISSHLDETGMSSLEFVDDILNDCHIYAELLKPQSNLLHHSGRAAARATHATLGAKQTLPVLLSAYRRFEKTKEFSELALKIESLIVRYSYFSDHDPVLLSSTLYKAAKYINEAASKKSALDGATELLESINPTDKEVILGSQRQMKLNKIPALYILRELENSLSDDAFKAHATLEHIFPQTPTTKHWGQAVGRLEPYLSHVGNLTLLASNDNSRASNRGFSYKKREIYNKSNVKITKSITNYRSWGIQPILRRAEELAKLVNKRWN